MAIQLASENPNISVLKLSDVFLQKRVKLRAKYLALVELSQVVILEICSKKVHRKWNFVKHRIDILIDFFHGKNRLKTEVGQRLHDIVDNERLSSQQIDLIFSEALFFLVSNGYIEESADYRYGIEPFVKTYRVTLQGLKFLRKHPLIRGY